MESKEQVTGTLYTTEVLEFAALGVKTAALLEGCALEKRPFIEQALSLLPQLYYATLRLPDYLYNAEEDLVPEFVSEESYERIRLGIASLLDEDDSFLSCQGEEMQYSDTPLAVFVSEYLADVYQQVGNLLGVLRDENERALPAAIGRCILYFREYWGAHLLEALTSLHRTYTQLLRLEEDDEDYADDNEEDEEYL